VYNYLNLPERIEFDDCKVIEFTYDANGAKLRKELKNGAMLLSTHDYLGSIEYKGNELEAIYHEEGRVYYEGGTGRYEYSIRDHLGNTRLTFTDKDGDGTIEISDDVETTEVLQENHYYPFGLSLNGEWIKNPGREDKYQYNGKELNEDFGLNWYDYGARWYMPDIARWGQVDPLAEKMASWSPFNYSFNNPIRFIDPDGTIPFNTIFVDEAGNELHRTVDNLDDAVVVVKNENLQTFGNALSTSLLSPNSITDSDVQNLRSFGDNYMVEGLNKLWDASANAEKTTDHNFYKNGQKAALTPEYAADFSVTPGKPGGFNFTTLKNEPSTGAILDIDLSTLRTSNDPTMVGLGTGKSPVAHTHPQSGDGLSVKEGLFYFPVRRFDDNNPSGNDFRNAAGSKRQYFDVIVSKNQIILYNGNRQQINVPRSFFK